MTQRQRNSIIEFVRREYGRMVGYVRSRIDDMAERDGEDIVQDVVAGLFVRADVTVPIENLAAYVYRALRNRVVDAMRRRRPTVSLDAPLQPGGSDGAGAMTLGDVIPGLYGDPERLHLEARRAEQLAQAVGKLSEDQRAVLVATEVQGKSFAELAAQWDVPIGTLLARKSRAMARVRTMLSEEDKGEEERHGSS
jgi:RNA polymerase sigma factor (sigma-70 family)